MASNSFGPQSAGLRVGSTDASRIQRACYSVDVTDAPAQLLSYRPGRVQALIDCTSSQVLFALIGTKGQVLSDEGSVCASYPFYTLYGAGELWIRQVGGVTVNRVGVIDEYYE